MSVSSKCSICPISVSSYGDVIRRKCTDRQTESCDAFASDAQHQDQITEDPAQDQVGSERLICVVHAPLLLLLRLHKRRQRALDRRLELAINIGLGFVDFLDEVGLPIFLLRLSFGKRLTLVGPFGSPRDIVPVTESVHHQHVDRTGHATEVGPGRGEHVPRIHVQETRQEVDTVGRQQGDQDDTGARRTKEGLEERADSITHGEIQSTSGKGVLHKIERQNQNVGLNDGEIEKGKRVKQAGTVIAS